MMPSMARISVSRIAAWLPAIGIVGSVAVSSGCGGHDPAPMVSAEDCESCHIQDFLNASDPLHVGEYPERCVACHNNVAWRPDDNRGHEIIFPVAGTDHDGLTCDDCHPAPQRTLGFTCTECHAHEQPDMDAEHRDEDGYTYESVACLDCHPDGSE